MKLTELNPKFGRDGFLVFDCPVCNGDRAHRIRVSLAPALDKRGQSWSHIGEFPDSLTLTPSVDAGCWHGFIKAGEVA